MIAGSLFLTAIAALLILTLLVAVLFYLRHLLASRRNLRSSLQPESRGWSLHESTPFNRPGDIQAQYSFLISPEYIHHLCSLAKAHIHYLASRLTHIAQVLSGLFNRRINEPETNSISPRQEVKIKSISIKVNNNQVVIGFSLNSPHNLAPSARYLLFIRLCPQDQDISYLTRCYVLDFSGNDRVWFQQAIPLPPVFNSNDSVIDNEGNLRSGARSAPIILCEIYLGRRKLHSHKLTPEVDDMYRQILNSL